MVYSLILSHLTLSSLFWTSIYAQPVALAGGTSSLQSRNNDLGVDEATSSWNDVLAKTFTGLIAYPNLKIQGIAVQATAVTSVQFGNYNGEPASSPESGDLEAWLPTRATFAYSREGHEMTKRFMWNTMKANTSDHTVRWDFPFKTWGLSADASIIPVTWPPAFSLADAIKIVKPRLDQTMLIKVALYMENANGIYWGFDAGPTAKGQESSADVGWKVYVNGTTEHVYGPKPGDAPDAIASY